MPSNTPELLLSVEEVADRLKLHVKTVRNFVRDGRLKATRIGKQYRIALGDLEAFTGQPAAAPMRSTVKPGRSIEASSVVQIEAIDRDASTRITNTVMAAANSRREGDQPLRVDSIYDEERACLKVIVIGSPGTCAEIFQLIGVLSES